MQDPRPRELKPCAQQPWQKKKVGCEKDDAIDKIQISKPLIHLQVTEDKEEEGRKRREGE
ncbi:hypothetical protein DVH24_021414 [Malus domestica]|uniref:Uncharacterized protein n=1 Tax=Malus domestica TaxID=3750 RepID=A0A498K1L6_MALDO|nr:hypothetical protein DVH24_021414 [Malus domestica]